MNFILQCRFVTWDTHLEVDLLRACFKVGFICLGNSLHHIGDHIGERALGGRNHASLAHPHLCLQHLAQSLARDSCSGNTGKGHEYFERCKL